MCVVTLTWLVNNLNCCNPQHFGLGWSSSGCSPCVLRQKHVLGLFVSLSMLSPNMLQPIMPSSLFSMPFALLCFLLCVPLDVCCW